jgi:quercetin dioxygenase-like cupin family protein
VKVTVVPGSGLEFITLPGRESADPFRLLGGGMAEIGLSVRVVRMAHDPSRSAHVHAHSAEAVYVVGGHGTLWADGERHPLRAGDTVLVPAGTPHATLPDPGEDMLLVCFFPHPDLAANIQELSGPLS